ncbi:hypothetical protein [Delftia tsuruhatensis]|uniref:hypothetical protein n=1 Tax=Delftia tsuruhatensis TaxID=180282 RepID=UPI0028A7EA0D|nr:hypothetical protein [Delftia tsuruhatensis]
MFIPRIAKKIESKGYLRCVRRIFFTSLEDKNPESSFHLREFYQYGSGVLLRSKDQLYLLTASHVIRNATNNIYLNNSPFWITAEDLKTGDLSVMDFIYPRRYHDESPGKDYGIDASIAEMNPMAFNVGPYLDWDNEELFVNKRDDAIGSTAVISGFPSELNQYKYIEEPDGRYRSLATINRENFRCEVSQRIGCGDYILKNLTTKPDNFDYSGLSGGIVACDVLGSIKYLGIATDYMKDGSGFYVVSFEEIRQRLGKIFDLPWQVLDESYFMKHPFRRDMNYGEFMHQLSNRGDFIHSRHNEHLSQIMRSLNQPISRSWFNTRESLAHSLVEYKSNLIYEMTLALRLLSKKKEGYFQEDHYSLLL